MKEQNLKITLLGYGKMGKAVEAEAKKRGHQISYVIDLQNEEVWEEINKDNTDIFVEFTHPRSFEQNLRKAIGKGIPIVTGTTGWDERKEQLCNWVEQKGGSMLYASNFSVGVNILFQLNKRLAQLMEQYAEYDCFIEEQHHKYKADAPSGTAIQLGNQIIEALSRKSRLSDETLRTRSIEKDELSVGYIRGGEIFGKHTVTYHSDIDTLQISHHAHSRRGFALGAVIAAEWLYGKTGVYDFSELFK